MNNKLQTFQESQQQFCHWIRDPKQSIPQSFDTERMHVYRELLFNNVSSFINLVYPVARSILPEQRWQFLLEEFFQKSLNQSPSYNDISLQFREYLEEQQHPVLQEYPWLAELLQYEWLELYLDTLEIAEKQYIEAPVWQLKTQVWVLVYQYPVYRWALNQTELEQAPSAIMVWRNLADQVCVEALSPLFAYLIEKLNQAPLAERELRNLMSATLPDLTVQEVDLQMNALSDLLSRLELIHVPQDCAK